MNLRQVRGKIKSINNVKKITRAMQMISAIKMRKAQAAEVEGRPYRLELERVIKKIIGNIDTSSSPLLSVKEGLPDKELIIFITSNKGLAGSFHGNIDRFLLKNVDTAKTDFITVGKKGAIFVNKIGGKIIADYSTTNALMEVTALFRLALQEFYKGNYAKISIMFNRFISTLKSETEKDTILPFNLGEEFKSETIKEKKEEYLIEPSPKELIDPLLRNFIEEKIRGAIISSEAVEHSARMIAMKNATDNADDITYNLTLLSNKIRQSRITAELLDMITAKESVEN